MSVHVLVVSGGHPFEYASTTADAFNELFESLPGVTYEHVAHPDAGRRLQAGKVGADVAVLYDMPGLSVVPGQRPVARVPDPEVQRAWAGLLEAGQPLLFMHHSICSWPLWDEYAELIGGRFQYLPGMTRGVWYPESGFRLDVPQRLRPLTDHPICSGLEDGLSITDETYLCPVFEDSITPIFASDAEMDDTSHVSVLACTAADPASYEPRRRLPGRTARGLGWPSVDVDPLWSHPVGSRHVVWTKTSGNSPVVYIQPGHGPSTWSNARYQRLLSNSLAWLANHEGT